MRSKFQIFSLFFLCIFFGSVNSFSQVLSAEELESKPVFKNLSDAEKNPLEVFRLDLSGQDLTEVPQAIYTFTNLNELSLSNNALVVFPKEILSLKNLQIIHADHNQFLVLPAAIGDLANLHTFSLNNNKLVSLPESFGNLTKLKS
jgi:Leucine-rich repeat (LRR) protein